MALTIVWRNPEPLVRTKQTLQRIQGDESSAVYVVTNSDNTQEFRVDLHREQCPVRVSPCRRIVESVGATIAIYSSLYIGSGV